MAYRDYSTALGKIVDANGKGDYTTITAAMADASSGDVIFVKEGTYTEDFTGIAGVSLVSFDSGLRQTTVQIIGKITFTAAGTFSVSGIRLTTNSDYFLEISGTAASIVNLNDCFLECVDNTGISYTTTSSSADLTIIGCLQDITATFALFEKSSPGTMLINYTYALAATQTTTPNTVTAGGLSCNYSTFGSPFSLSGSSFSFFMLGMTVDTVGITTSGTVSGQILFSNIDSNTSAGVSIGAGTSVRMNPTSRINNTAANAITGGGTLLYSALSFPGTASFNPTTITAERISIPRISSSSGVNAIVTSTNGEVNFPNTPTFLVYLSSTESNVTGDGTLAIVGAINGYTEVTDVGGNFSGTVFTAPVSGNYLLSGSIFLGVLGAGHNQGIFQVNTSNRNYTFYMGNVGAMRDSGNQLSSTISHVANMDMGDISRLLVQVGGSTKTVAFGFSTATNPLTIFSGSLQS